MELKNKKINFLGDSITYGHGTSSEEHIFMNVLKEKCGLAEVRNYGECGTRIARQKVVTADPFDRDFNLRADYMDDDADAVVVFGGTNDYGHGSAPFGNFEDRDVQTFYGALHSLILKLKEKYAGKPIVFMTPAPRSDEEGIVKEAGVKPIPLIDYVNAIREVCKYRSVPVVDLYDLIKVGENRQEFFENYMPDGLHPNDRLHLIIEEILEDFLKKL